MAIPVPVRYDSEGTRFQADRSISALSTLKSVFRAWLALTFLAQWLGIAEKTTLGKKSWSACRWTKLNDSTDKSPFSQSSATVTSSTRNLPSEPESHILPSVCVPKVTPLSLDDFLLCEQKRITDITLLRECAVSVSVSVSDLFILPGKVHQTKSTPRTPTKVWGTVQLLCNIWQSASDRFQ